MSRKPYLREVPKTRWFFRHPRYLRYMAREVTCIFIGAYTLLLVAGIERLSAGQAAYEAFLRALQGPAAVLFLIVALGFALYHTATWFNLTPKALPIQVGGEFLPDAAITGAHYLGWVLVSLAILYWAGAF